MHYLLLLICDSISHIPGNLKAVLSEEAKFNKLICSGLLR